MMVCGVDAARCRAETPLQPRPVTRRQLSKRAYIRSRVWLRIDILGVDIWLPAGMSQELGLPEIWLQSGANASGCGMAEIRDGEAGKRDNSGTECQLGIIWSGNMQPIGDEDQRSESSDRQCGAPEAYVALALLCGGEDRPAADAGLGFLLAKIVAQQNSLIPF